MLSETDVLERLDNYRRGSYCQFVNLGYLYSYLIDCRLNIFNDTEDQWAIVSERLGYNPRAGRIDLDICYFGNCLINLGSYNGQEMNCYSVSPIESESFYNTEEGEALKSDARFWIVRDQRVNLTHATKDYHAAKITLEENEPDEVLLVEAGRLAVSQNRELFRATDEELYKSIPKSLKKILVLDEWYHRDFNDWTMPEMSEEEIKVAYDFNKSQGLGDDYPDFETFFRMVWKQKENDANFNLRSWTDNRPSAYETWKLLAKVIASDNPNAYRPTLKPNTHWAHWPTSGSL